MKQVKIALILVNMFPGAHHDAMQPILFAIIDELTPQGVSLSFFDERIKPLPDDISADLIALSVDTFSAARAYQLAERFRSEGKTVVLGGIHVTSVPEEAKQHSDAIVIGEAEDTWPRLVEDFKQVNLKPVYRSNQPALSTFDPNHPAIRTGYLPLGIMETSRGCQHRCDFCSVKVLYPGAVRRKPLALVEQEIMTSPHKLLFFVDDNLYSDQTYFLGLMRLLRKHHKRWAAQVSLEIAQSEQMLRIAKRSGGVLLLIGLESLTDDSLRQMGKKHNRQTDLRQLVQRIQRHGLLLYGTFVFGYEGDTPERVRQVLDFGMSLGMSVLNFNPLQPMPGTPLYARLHRQGRLKSDSWWLDPAYRYGAFAFEPTSADSQELSGAIEWARQDFYSRPSSFKRWYRQPHRLDPVLSGIHFLLNHISRREINRKQGRSFYETNAD